MRSTATRPPASSSTPSGEQGIAATSVLPSSSNCSGRRAGESVLGAYDIDKNGDTTLTDYGAYRIAGGELRFTARSRLEPSDRQQGARLGGSPAEAELLEAHRRTVQQRTVLPHDPECPHRERLHIPL
jgi:hypothetical protein